jgi:hypothetical protein
MWEHSNELEQAFADAHLGMEQKVEYFRLLRESNLTFILPYHPELAGENKIPEDGKMVITIWYHDKEGVIPIFTSPERLDEAMAARGKPGELYACGQMLGKELLRAFCSPHNTYRVVVNPGCACGARFMDPELVRSIVDGSALQLPTPGEQAMEGLVISLPDHQPERLRRPLAKFLAGIPEVKAAWLFYEEEPKLPFEKVFVFGLAIASVCPRDWDSRAIIMNPKDPGFTDIMRCPSFYRTPDYEPPPKPAEPPPGDGPAPPKP